MFYKVGICGNDFLGLALTALRLPGFLFCSLYFPVLLA